LEEHLVKGRGDPCCKLFDNLSFEKLKNKIKNVKITFSVRISGSCGYEATIVFANPQPILHLSWNLTDNQQP